MFDGETQVELSRKKTDEQNIVQVVLQKHRCTKKQNLAKRYILAR